MVLWMAIKNEHARRSRSTGAEFREVVSSCLLDAQGVWSIRPSFLTGFHSVPRMPFFRFLEGERGRIQGVARDVFLLMVFQGQSVSI